MGYAVPTLADLLDRSRKAFRASLPGTDAWIWPNNITVSAKVIAGAVFEAFGFASYISKMMFVSTAPDLETLVLHGNEFGVPLRPATAANGSIQLTTVGDCGVDVNAVFQRADGVQYFSTATVARTGAGTLSFPVTAAVNGATTNATDGTPFEIVSGVTGEASAAADGDIVGGADIEDKETYRQRLLLRKRNPPHGGAPSDYVLWAESVSGVTRTYVERLWAGIGTVRVFPIMDDLYPDGIASVDDIARVTAYIDTVHPAGAVVTVQAPTPVPVNVQVSLLSPDTPTIREAVIAELRHAFRTKSVVAGSDTKNDAMPFLAIPASFSRSWINQAVSDATGEDRHVLVAPSGDVSLVSGQMATLGTVTFI